MPGYLNHPFPHPTHSTFLLKPPVPLLQPGAVFVKPEVRPGLLPSILSALVSARSATRAQLKEASDPAARAVLDSRQKALKVRSCLAACQVTFHYVTHALQ